MAPFIKKLAPDRHQVLSMSSVSVVGWSRVSGRCSVTPSSTAPDQCGMVFSMVTSNISPERNSRFVISVPLWKSSVVLKNDESWWISAVGYQIAIWPFSKVTKCYLNEQKGTNIYLTRLFCSNAHLIYLTVSYLYLLKFKQPQHTYFEILTMHVSRMMCHIRTPHIGHITHDKCCLQI